MSEPTKWITANEVAEMLHVSYRTVMRMSTPKDGLRPALIKYKIGGSKHQVRTRLTRYLLADVEKLLQPRAGDTKGIKVNNPITKSN